MYRSKPEKIHVETEGGTLSSTTIEERNNERLRNSTDVNMRIKLESLRTASSKPNIYKKKATTVNVNPHDEVKYRRFFTPLLVASFGIPGAAEQFQSSSCTSLL